MIRHIGRTRKRLAKLLSEATGLTFLPSKVYPVKGWARSSTAFYNDSFRWSAVPEEKGEHMLDSYSTMTACVRYGFAIQDGEVFAKEPETCWSEG